MIRIVCGQTRSVQRICGTPEIFGAIIDGNYGAQLAHDKLCPCIGHLGQRLEVVVMKTVFAEDDSGQGGIERSLFIRPLDAVLKI